ncbi:MAG: DUF2341 domain-containing protein [Chitinispirillia bacterium]|nr:DUF2341 domain-containing protein [Chitinispirillia bacterium]
MKTLLLFLTLFLLTLSCTNPGGYAGGSETGNGAVYAAVTYEDGTPAAGSEVRLRKADYVSSIPALSKMSAAFADMVTDSDGRFMIDSIPAGDYFIEIINNNSSRGGAVLLKFTIMNDRDIVDLGTDTLRSFASLLGEIDNAAMTGQRLFVQIIGLERLAPVNENGTFAFDDLPAGTHRIRIVDGAAIPVREVQSVQVSPGDTSTVTISPFSKNIQINTADAGLSSFDVIENFPLLIRLESPAFNFSQAHQAGNDIRFNKPNGQSLHYEIEEWDPLLGKAAVWVLADSIRGDGSDQSIVMSWGTPDAPSLSNGAAVFNSDFGFSGVWHFNENPSAGSSVIKNRTVNDFHGTASSSMTSANVVSGIAGNALYFDGISDFIEAGLLDLDENYTLSLWVKIERGPNVNWRFIMKEPSYTLWYDTRWGGFRAEHFTYGNASDEWEWRGIYQDTGDSLPNLSAELDVWYHIAASYDGDKIRLFINGDAVDSTLHIAEKPLSGGEPLLFGGRFEEFFRGTMDEVRIESTARCAYWIRLSYETQRIGSKAVR